MRQFVLSQVACMKSTPTEACEIDGNVEPLNMRRDPSVLEMFERYKRNDDEHPNKNWLKNGKE